MPLPQTTFSTFQQLFTYINTYWVPNDNGDIDAIVGNNVVNGLLTFITQSPLNYQKSLINVATGPYVATRPVTIFTASAVPTNVSWSDNIYNELVFANTTVNPIPLLSGFFYRDIDMNAVSEIPPKTILVLYKAVNDQWVSATASSGSGGYLTSEVQWQSGVSIELPNDTTQLTFTASNVDQKSLKIFLDGAFQYKNLTDRTSYTVVFTLTDFTITFNQPTSQGQVYNISYGQNL